MTYVPKPPPLGIPRGAQPVAYIPPAPFELDEHQLAAADHREGPAVVASVAGSGKTTVIVERVADLMREGVIPEAICVLTYNKDNRATLNTRLALRIGGFAARVQVFTFHAWGYALLRHWYPRDPRLAPERIIGASKGPSAASLIFAAAKDAGIDREISWKDWHGYVGYLLEAMVVPGAPAKSVHDALDLPAGALDRSGTNPSLAEQIARFYQSYETLKRDKGWLDFADMVVEIAQAIRQTPEAEHVDRLRRMYQHVMADEIQDGNVSRFELLLWLGSEATSMMAVGDARQCQPAGTVVHGAYDGEDFRDMDISEVREGCWIHSWRLHQTRSTGVLGTYGRVSSVSQRLYTGWIYKVTTTDGQSTRCTDTHRWWVNNCGLAMELTADGLYDGLRVPVWRDSASYCDWQPITVTREWVVDLPVYSLDVEYTHAYVADGICTMNSIYGFTGARPDLFMSLVQPDGPLDPPAKLYTLPVNRRSTARIVDAGNRVAYRQPWCLGGDAEPRPGAPQGEPVQVWESESPSDEVDRIVRDLRGRGVLPPEGTKPPPLMPPIPGQLPEVQIKAACLFRTNAMIVDAECGFVARGVPVRVAGSTGGVWGTSVGKDVLSYLRAAQGIAAWGLLDVANKPKRFIRKKDMSDIVRAVRDAEAGRPSEQASIWQMGKQPAEPLLHAAVRASGNGNVRRLHRDLEGLRKKPWAKRCAAVGDLLERAVIGKGKRGRRGHSAPDPRTGLTAEESDRIEAYKALARYAAGMADLDALENAVRRSTADEARARILLSTIHLQKGAEHPIVYVCGVRPGKLPHERCEDEAEERRLLYVAVTRAIEVCVISSGGDLSPLVDQCWLRLGDDWRDAAGADTGGSGGRGAWIPGDLGYLEGEMVEVVEARGGRGRLRVRDTDGVERVVGASDLALDPPMR